jgi:hypothetical protein
MDLERENVMNCEQFENNLSDYLDKNLDAVLQKAAAAHALSCPLCHSLLNEVKASVAICRTLSDTNPLLTSLEAKILARTIPEAGMKCPEFEDHLTDYLDGFLPAAVFHRWERHAALCNDCTDLPGTVVRSLAALVEFKLDELPLPNGLNERIIRATIGSEPIGEPRESFSDRVSEWIRGFKMPIAVPQFAPVVLMFAFGFLVISQSVSADGSLTDVYSKSVRLAEQTYRQSSEALRGIPQADPEPINGSEAAGGGN